MPKLLFFTLTLLTTVVFICCQPENKPNANKKHPKNNFNKDSVKNQFIKANKQIVQKESDEMDYYVKAHQMPFIKTNSGLRYYVYKPSAKGDSIKKRMQLAGEYADKASIANNNKQYRLADSLSKLSMELKQVTLEYEVRLLNGTICYSSKTDGKKTFAVEEGDIETGIHKALFYFKTGDHALVLIPSYLAHGLLGDFKKIPPQMPIVYDIKIQ